MDEDEEPIAITVTQFDALPDAAGTPPEEAAGAVDHSEALQANALAALDGSLRALLEKYAALVPPSAASSPLSSPRQKKRSIKSAGSPRKWSSSSSFGAGEDEAMQRHRVQVITSSLQGFVRTATEQVAYVCDVWLKKEAFLLTLLHKKDAQLMTALQRERAHVNKLRENMRACKRQFQAQQDELEFLYEQYKQIESSYNHFATHCKLTYSESGSLVDFNRARDSFVKQLESLTRRIDAKPGATVALGDDVLEDLATDMQLFQTPDIMRQRILFLNRKLKAAQNRLEQYEQVADARLDTGGESSLEDIYQERRQQVIVAEQQRIGVLVVTTRKRVIPALWELKSQIVALKDTVAFETLKMTQLLDQASHGVGTLVQRTDFGAAVGGREDRGRMAVHRAMVLALRDEVAKVLTAVGMEVPDKLLQVSLGSQMEGFNWDRMATLITGLIEQVGRLEELASQLEEARGEQRALQGRLQQAMERERAANGRQKALNETTEQQANQIAGLRTAVSEKDEKIRQLVKDNNYKEEKTRDLEANLDGKEKALQAARAEVNVAQKRYRESMAAVEELRLKLMECERLAEERIEEERALRMRLSAATQEPPPAPAELPTFHDMILKAVGPLLREAADPALQAEMEAMVSFGKLMDSAVGLFDRLDDPEDEAEAARMKQETRGMLRAWFDSIVPAGGSDHPLATSQTLWEPGEGVDAAEEPEPDLDGPPDTDDEVGGEVPIPETFSPPGEDGEFHYAYPAETSPRSSSRASTVARPRAPASGKSFRVVRKAQSVVTPALRAASRKSIYAADRPEDDRQDSTEKLDAGPGLGRRSPSNDAAPEASSWRRSRHSRGEPQSDATSPAKEPVGHSPSMIRIRATHPQPRVGSASKPLLRSAGAAEVPQAREGRPPGPAAPTRIPGVQRDWREDPAEETLATDPDSDSPLTSTESSAVAREEEGEEGEGAGEAEGAEGPRRRPPSRHHLVDPFALEVVVTPNQPRQMQVCRRAEDGVVGYGEVHPRAGTTTSNTAPGAGGIVIGAQDYSIVCPHCGEQFQLEAVRRPGSASPTVASRGPTEGWSQRLRMYRLERQMLLQRAVQLWNKIMTRYHQPFRPTSPLRVAKSPQPGSSTQSSCDPLDDKPLLIGSRSAAVPAPVRTSRSPSRAPSVTVITGRMPTLYDVLAEPHRLLHRDLNPSCRAAVPPVPSLPPTPCAPPPLPTPYMDVAGPRPSLPLLSPSGAHTARPSVSTAADRRMTTVSAADASDIGCLDIRPLSTLRALGVADGTVGQLWRAPTGPAEARPPSHGRPSVTGPPVVSPSPGPRKAKLRVKDLSAALPP